MPHLINASKSKRGWSYYSAWFKCHRYWAYQNLPGIEMPSNDAQTLGSCVHTGLAHYFARRGAKQKNGFHYNGKHVKDPDYFYEPIEAMEAWASLNDAYPNLEKALDTYEYWMESGRYKYGPNYQVVGVEEEFDTVLGEVDFGNDEPVWGMWLYKLNDDGEFIYSNTDGAEFKIEPTCLDFEGHPRDGEPIGISRRMDLVVDDDMFENSRTIDDHKVTGSDTSTNRELEYRASGEFTVSRLIGRQAWGDKFAGCRLHFVATLGNSGTPRDTNVWPVKPMQYDLTFATDLFVAAHEIARDELTNMDENGEIDPFGFTPSRHMDVCKGQYLCSGFELCQKGRAALINGRAMVPQPPRRKRR